MNDPRRPERFSPPLPGSGPTASWRPAEPPADPAYADQAPYAPGYGGYAYTPPWTSESSNLNEANPTKRLPPYWQQHESPSGGPPPDGPDSPPPEGPSSPRWLWVAACVAVLLVVGLVIALILATNATKTQTAVPPLPAMPSSSAVPTPSNKAPPRAPSRVPSPTAAPPIVPSETTSPGAMQTVVYSVTGEGRAISIMYIDADGVIQTAFNVPLPWSKEVNLAQSAAHPPSVTIVNIGHNVTCSVTVDGVQMRQRVGQGLTICDARS
jgi:Mycobacterium membrane protein